MSKLRDINDPRLSKNARNVIRAALTHFAEHHDVELSGVIELYEYGFIEMERCEDGVAVDLSLPPLRQWASALPRSTASQVDWP